MNAQMRHQFIVFAHTYLPRALILGLLALLCWQLARWTWLVAVPTPPVAAMAPEPAIDATAVREAFANAALFDSRELGGRPDLPARSTLNLKLVGVLQSTAGRSPSLAVMNLNGKANELYAEGGEIASGIVLHRISRDHVVIRRDGALERVDFPERPTAARNATGFNLNVQQHSAGQYSFSRDTLNRALQDPGQIAQLGGLAFVPGSGAVVGVVPAGSLLEKLGLQQGDTIDTVNGERLSTQHDLLRLYQKFSSAGQVTLQGSRAGAPLKLTYAVQP